jgi:hypothetical protein
MATIEVDFEVYKALTAKRAAESVTYNEVIRQLLGFGSNSSSNGHVAGAGVVFKGVEFPEGTQFRATYKGKTYTGEIKGGVWIDSKGKPQSSPSQAAYNITGSGINGWRFWECSRPSDPSWILIDNLR